ncbi:hypothetical protein FDP41_002855 [Naegleria fowleri]|uniref:Uncharacterized protein n=1 Tax=Naegleria fowleri TaxID=5763 RepID=A0A6A5BXK1_NAEFO|nr:uncharacterized protein FDP41_002855 [Naegleria fowleri]KAF0978340.1 hypothetical protein FDP41_002855 [Naegleria fowleri]
MTRRGELKALRAAPPLAVLLLFFVFIAIGCRVQCAANLLEPPMTSMITSLSSTSSSTTSSTTTSSTSNVFGFNYTISTANVTILTYDLTSPANTKIRLVFHSPNLSSQFVPYQVMTLKLPKSDFQYFPKPYNPLELTLLGVYQVNIYPTNMNSIDKNNVTMDSLFIFPQGIVNTYASSVVQYLFENSQFVQISNTYSSPLGMNAFTLNNLTQTSVTFGVFGYQMTPRMDSSVTVTGPSIFQYTLDSSRQQYFTLTFPYQVLAQDTSPYFTLSDYYLGSSYSSSYLPSGYVALKSFTYSLSRSPPNTLGQEFIFNFDPFYGFTDSNGKSISILKSTLTCACASSSYSKYNILYNSVTSSGQLTCTPNGVACNYLVIIAKPTVTPSPSPSSPSSSITRLPLGGSISSYVDSNSGQKYFKVSMYSQTTVKLSIYSTSGYGFMKVKKDSLPSSTDYDQFEIVNSFTSSLTVTNYLYTSRELYIMVYPSSSSMSFTISATSHSIYDTSLYPAVVTGIVFACLFTLFSLIAIITIVYTISKHKNRQYV